MIYTKRCVGTIAYMGGLPAVLEAFTWSWGQMIAHCYEYLCNPGEYVAIDHATVSLHDFARNSLAERFQGDWLLMFDTDHAPEPDLPMRLVTLANKIGADVVVGVYCHKTAPHVPVIYQWDEGGGPFVKPIAAFARDVSAIQVGSAGAGCLWVRRTVYDRIAAELKEPPFARQSNLGEDHSFFDRCRRLGIPVYAAPQIEANHLQVRPITLADYDLNPLPVLGGEIEVQGFA